jgi:polyisoprenoid-binding protein YceI
LRYNRIIIKTVFLSTNMKNFFFLFLLAFATMSFFAPDTYKVDTTASNIAWVGYKVTGKHNGDVKMKGGSLSVDKGVITGGSFEIDMNSITCADLQGEYAGKLVGHLKSDDFFGAAKFPTAKFVITRAIPTDSKGGYKIIGNLTIKEATKEVRFNATSSMANGAITANGTLKIDRSDYNIRFGSGTFFENLGDKTIYDEFDLTVSLTAKK